jgi:hypothetical protein
LLEANGRFSLVGWFENLEFLPLKTVKGYNMVILKSIPP